MSEGERVGIKQGLLHQNSKFSSDTKSHSKMTLGDIKWISPKFLSRTKAIQDSSRGDDEIEGESELDKEEAESGDAQHKLPHFSIASDSSKNGSTTVMVDDIVTTTQSWILMDWPVDDRLFTQENYRTLESVLSHYPSATIRILLPAPSDSQGQKLGGLLSTNHFIKYRKLGYDISIVTAGDKKRPSGPETVGKKYSDKWVTSCCGASVKKSTDHLQPYHLLNYLRLSYLWRRGGVFTDFSFFTLGSLDIVKQGFYLNSFCLQEDQLEIWQLELSGSENWRRMRCHTSTLLVFNEPKSEVLMCAIKKYDDDNFVQCIESDDAHGGAECIAEVLKDCFAAHGVRNDLSPRHKSDSKHPLDLSPLETFGGDAAKASKVLLSPHWKLSAHKRVLWLGSLAFTGSWSGPYPKDSLLAEASESISLKTLPIVDQAHSAAQHVSLGVKGSLGASSPRSSPMCSHYSTSLPFLTKSRQAPITSYRTGIEQVSCAPAAILAGFPYSAQHLMTLLASHPRILPPLLGGAYSPSSSFPSAGHDTYCYSSQPSRRLLARAWCFPHISPGEPFVIVDATTTYGLDRTVPEILLADAPQAKALFVVRHPVDRMYAAYSSASRNSGSYGNKFQYGAAFDDFAVRALARTNKFGMMRQMIANGSSLDEVIETYYNSSFTATGPGVGVLNQLFMHSIPYPAIAYYKGVLGPDNVLVVNADDLELAGLNNGNERVRETMNKVFKFLGVEPYAIDDAVLSALSATASTVAPSLSSGSSSSPPSPSFEISRKIAPKREMSQWGYRRLNKFFLPFIAELEKVSGLNLTTWSTRSPPSYLPLYTPSTAPPIRSETGINATETGLVAVPGNMRGGMSFTMTPDSTSRPTLWFEMETNKIAAAKRGGIMTHLLPKKNAEIDSGFNTSIGLFNAF